MSLVYQRQQQQQQREVEVEVEEKPFAVDSSGGATLAGASPSPRNMASVSSSLVGRLIAVFSLLLLILLLLLPWASSPLFFFSSAFSSSDPSRWKDYTLAQAASFVARDQTVIVCTVSRAFLPFLNNWLISVALQGRHHQVLVLAEDYDTLFEINSRWPGHAVLIPPALDLQAARNFGSQGFFNFTSRRPRHLLKILELGYNVMYNDVDMVWLADPFPYLVGNHDIYFEDDISEVKPLNQSHELPPPGADGYTYMCSCFIFLRPTGGAKTLVRTWVEELRNLHWSPEKGYMLNDQPPLNWALNKTAPGQVDPYVLPQAAFPTGGLYFRNSAWVEETRGMHVVVHNNYIVGYEAKLQRFRHYGLWFADDHADQSPLGKID